MASEELVVHGAREHNLKDFDVRLPRNKLICITGLSGSGKSSLAFDTIYAEGQRRYVESLSAYARQFLQMMEKPDVDSIEGLSPAISIDQKTTSRNPRSTVGTVTEIYDYLRLLYARVGRPHCPVCGKPITGQSQEAIVDQILQLAEGTKFTVNAPVVRDRKGEYKDVFEELRNEGFTRVKVDGVQHLLDRMDQAVAVAQHDVVELAPRGFAQAGIACLQRVQVQADRGDGRLQLVGDGVDERVVLLVAPDLPDQKRGVEDEAGDDGGKDDDAEDQQPRVADVQDDPPDVERHRGRAQADAEGHEKGDGAPAAGHLHREQNSRAQGSGLKAQGSRKALKA